MSDRADTRSFIGRLKTSPGSAAFQAHYDDRLVITGTANTNINGLDTWGNGIAWAADLAIDGVGLLQTDYWLNE